MEDFFGHPEITEQLIEAHANSDLHHQNGYTSLMIAAYCGHAAVATLLLASRDDIDVQTVDLDTAIIATLGIGRLRGCCEEEEDKNDVDSVEEDEDEEEDEPLSD
jgi:ankyrin repeat protein